MLTCRSWPSVCAQPPPSLHPAPPVHTSQEQLRLSDLATTMLSSLCSWKNDVTMLCKRKTRRRQNVLTYASTVILCSTLLVVASQVFIPQSHLQERLAIWWSTPQLQSPVIIKPAQTPRVPTTHTDINSANSLKKDIFADESYNTRLQTGKWRNATSRVVSTRHVEGGQTGTLPYQDVSLSLEERVDDLVSRLTLAEVVQLSTARLGKPTQGVPRLGIQPYTMVTNCYQDQATSKVTTHFPRPIGLAATFSPDLVHNISNVMAIEIRAEWNRKSAASRQEAVRGLSCFTPLNNVLRHPLTPQAQDSFGEDVFLTSQMTSSFVLGLQGNHPRYIRVAAGCKYLVAHVGLNRQDVKVPLRDLEMTYLPPTHACVSAGAQSILTDHSRINGDVISQNKRLLSDVLRRKWGFPGYIIGFPPPTSMLQAPNFNSSRHITTSVHAGCNYQVSDRGGTYGELWKAVIGGWLTETEARENVKPLLKTRMRLGEFDPPTMSPYSDLRMTPTQWEKHEEQAVLAAMMSFVLLKNDNHTLPIWSGKRFSKIAVVGPFSTMAFRDKVSFSVTQEVLSRGLGKMGPAAHAPGCDQSCRSYEAESVEEAVTGAEVVFVCLGEVVGADREDMTLPGHQLKLLQDATRWAGQAPVILLLFTARPLDITWAQSSPRVPTILLCFLPGFGSGEALWRIVTRTGRKSAPAGRLPFTWPSTLQQMPAMTDYSMKGRTYRYFRGDPSYPFGYGLSYSSFNYTFLSVTPNVTAPGHDVTVQVGLRNLGPYGAEEIVQVYLSWAGGLAPLAPRLQLVAFQRVYLGYSAETSLSLLIKAEQMSLWVDKGVHHTVLPGEMRVYVGGQQPSQTTHLPSNVLTTTFTVSP